MVVLTPQGRKAYRTEQVMVGQMYDAVTGSS